MESDATRHLGDISMAKRERRHTIGEGAELAVASVWTSTGATVDFIKRDYGDDLLVQTALNGDMDPSRLWVQVKARGNLARFRLRTGDISLPIKVPHALRWARSSDLAVVVLWDTERSQGWWALPAEQINEYDLLMGGRATTSLRFDSDAIFDDDAALGLAWMARMHHASRVVASEASHRLSIWMTENSADEAVAPAARLGSKASVALFALLCDVGIIPPEGIPDSFIRKVRNVTTRFVDDGLSNDQALEAATSLAVLGAFDEQGAYGVPVLLLQSLAGAVLTILAGQHGFEAPQPASVEGPG